MLLSVPVYVCVQGYYFTGDGCKRDKDGYFWITGQHPSTCLFTWTVSL